MINLEKLKELSKEAEEIKKDANVIITEITRLDFLMESKLNRMKEILEEMKAL